jgi:aminoglycoside N3'-acetyltransferase
MRLNGDVLGEVVEDEIAHAAKHLGVAGAALCLHASLRSFPKLEHGPETLIDGLLSTGATVMVLSAPAPGGPIRPEPC